MGAGSEYSTMKRLIAAAILSLGVSQAHAADIYKFTEDGCTGTCGTAPFGTVTVTNDAVDIGSLDFTVELTPGSGETFQDSNSSQMHSLAFSLIGDPIIKIVGLPSPFTANGFQSAHTVNASTFGAFEYEINFPHESHPPAITKFSFEAKKNKVSDAALKLEFHTWASHPIYFSTDINGQNGNTGNVAATFFETTGGDAVPEPATWATMLVGFAGMGSALRRDRSRRRTALAAA